MKIALFLLSFFSVASLASDDVWISFWDEENHKIGFKDSSGAIKIPSKYMGMTRAAEFKNIIAVMEEDGESYDAYYLLKNGSKIDGVKMFTFDNGFDCESDKKIRFRDKETNAMGYLDHNGNIAIAPIYDIGQPFSNGLASVVKGASLVCHNGKPFTAKNRCEHAHWQGGENLVINSDNEIVIKNASLGYQLNRYSLSISNKPNDSEVIESFKSVDGRYFNFINTERHFEKWFKQNILSDLSKSNMAKNSFDELALFSDDKGWIKQIQSQFWNNNYKTVSQALSLLNQSDSSFFISLDSINQFIYEEDKYKPYYAQCYNLIDNQHPTLSVIANHMFEGTSVQNIYEFLKVKETYKIISITLRTGVLKE